MLVSSMILLSFQSFYTQMIRTSLKDEDSLDSFRVAYRLFSTIQEDLEQFDKLSTHGAFFTVDPTSERFPPTATFSSELSILAGKKRIDYSTSDSNDGVTKRVVRKVTDLQTNSSTKRFFGVAKIRGFETVYIKKQEKINGVGKDFGQLLVNVVVKSKDKTFPTEEVRLTSTFFPEHLESSTWNYLE